MVSRQGEIFDINIFLIVLGYSRFKFVMLTTDRVQKPLFECITEAFKYFNGVPKELLFDNMSTVIDRNVKTFKNVAINKEFKTFSIDAGFEVITRRPYRPKTKGKVETLAKLVDRLTPYNGELDTFEDLNEIVEDFNYDINNEVSQATNEIPFIEYCLSIRPPKPIIRPLSAS